MWRDVFNFANRLWTLLEDTERNKTEIKDLRREFRDLSLEVRALAMELRHQAHTEASEREKLVLKLENELLRFERRLPSGRKR